MLHSSSIRYRRAILATCCIPWTADWQFAEDIFRRQVARLIAGGIRDLYIFGTAGEGYAVTERQYDEITRVFLDETAEDDVQTMIGLISLSLPMVIERIERSRDLGGRRFQLSLPSWGRLSDTELATFFRETCGRFPDCEFLHYNLPRAQRLVTAVEYGALAEAHPNLVATKNSTADIERLQGLHEHAAELRHFITEAGFSHAALMGECGLLVSIGSLNFDACREFYDAGVNRDAEALAVLRDELAGLVAELKLAVGETAHMDGAYDKIFCRAHDPQFPLRLLPPYAAADDGACERFLRAVRSRFRRWAPAPERNSSP